MDRRFSNATSSLASAALKLCTEQLLLAPHARSRMFYMGNWEFDPAHVGVRSSSPFTGASLFDTRLPGNSNAGHTYGTNLSEEDRMALIEYLKTL